MENKINLLLIAPFSEDLIARIREVSTRLNVERLLVKQASEIPAINWESAEILYTSGVLPLPEQAPNLRWIQFHSAGIDHFVQEPILQNPDLVTTTLSGAHAPQMGEFVLMMLLALGHQLPEMFALKSQKEWAEDRWERLMPIELRDSTVGIVGYGSIGRQVARLLQSLGATVLATKRNAMNPEDTGYIPRGMGDPKGDFIRRLYPPQAIKSMLKECDFVVVAVPRTLENVGLVGKEELAVLKPHAMIVDVSRGDVIDHDALYEALAEKRIGGAALDVFPEEPLPQDSPFWDLPNCIISPHIGGITPFYDRRAVELFITNLHRYLAGQRLFNQVDVSRGY